MKKFTFDPSKIQIGEDIDLPEELDALISKKTEQAEQELEQTRMQIRWGTSQVEIIKRAAKLIGIPYQTYAKQILFRQAMEDIERIQNLEHSKAI